MFIVTPLGEVKQSVLWFVVQLWFVFLEIRRCGSTVKTFSVVSFKSFLIESESVLLR